MAEGKKGKGIFDRPVKSSTYAKGAKLETGRAFH